MKNSIKIDKGRTRLIAHRGLSGLELQNTAAAFILAAGRSYHGIETDIHRTADPHMYAVIHDGNTGNVSSDNIPIETSSAALLSSVRLRRGGIMRADMRIPMLEDYIQICNDYSKISVLELKSNFTEEEIQDIVTIISNSGHLDKTIFISFIRENLEMLRALLPSQPAQFLCGECNDELITYLAANRFGLDIKHSALSAENVSACHNAGIEVNTWTVDDPDVAARLVSWGVDYITTNILE